MERPSAASAWYRTMAHSRTPTPTPTPAAAAAALVSENVRDPARDPAVWEVVLLGEEEEEEETVRNIN